jgi:predicted metal-binding protein
VGSGVAVGVGAGLPGSKVSGRSQYRVAAFKVFARLALAVFFITISHCAWRRVISDMTFLVKSDGFDSVHVSARICAIS